MQQNPQQTQLTPNSQNVQQHTYNQLTQLRTSMQRYLQRFDIQYIDGRRSGAKRPISAETAETVLQLKQLWECIEENVGRQGGELFQMKSYAHLNEQYLLCSYKSLVALTDALSFVSKILQEQAYPLELNRAFRKVCEHLGSLSVNMHKFKSMSQQFNEAKQVLVQDHVCSLDSLKQDPRASTASTEDTKLQQKVREIEYLQRQIVRLEDLLELNNSQFSTEIKRYNDILYQQERELHDTQEQLKSMQVRIQQLQAENGKLTDEKMRDDMLIEYVLRIFRNMSRKLRTYEKEAGYLSPSRSRAQVRNYSPRSRMMKTQSTQPQPYYPNLRGRFAHSRIP